MHYLLLPGQGSPNIDVKSYDDLVSWALEYIRKVDPSRAIVVGHSLGGEVAKGVVWKLFEERRQVRGIGIAPAGSRKEIKYKLMAELGRALAFWRALGRGVSLRQLMSYIKLLKGEGYKTPPEFEIIHGTADSLVPKDWRQEFRKGGHFPFSAREVAKRIDEAATRLVSDPLQMLLGLAKKAVESIPPEEITMKFKSGTFGVENIDALFMLHILPSTQAYFKRALLGSSTPEAKEVHARLSQISANLELLKSLLGKEIVFGLKLREVESRLSLTPEVAEELIVLGDRSLHYYLLKGLKGEVTRKKVRKAVLDMVTALSRAERLGMKESAAVKLALSQIALGHAAARLLGEETRVPVELEEQVRQYMEKLKKMKLPVEKLKELAKYAI